MELNKKQATTLVLARFQNRVKVTGAWYSRDTKWITVYYFDPLTRDKINVRNSEFKIIVDRKTGRMSQPLKCHSSML
ncbi:MAG: hypothetical protein ACLP5V_03730 [Candidatus Bathyarchaeia archaeon]